MKRELKLADFKDKLKVKLFTTSEMIPAFLLILLLTIYFPKYATIPDMMSIFYS
jgi:hypothetical protein